MAEITTEDGVTIVSSDPAPAEAPPDPTEGAPADESAEPTAESPPAPPASDDDDDKPVSPRELNRIVRRFTRQRTDLEQRIGAVQAQNETLMRLLQTPAPPQPEIPQGPPRRPRQLDFESDDDYQAAEDQYLDAMVTYKLEQREGAQRVEQQRTVQQRSEAELMDIIRAREQEILQATPDYYERFEQIGPQLGDTLLWGLKQAGAVGPDLVLFLAEHPDEITRLRQIPPSRIGIELGRLLPGTAHMSNGNSSPQGNSRAQTSSNNAPSPPAPQRLPEPPQAVGGGGATATTTYRDDMTQQQFDEWSRRMYPGMPYTHRR